MPKQAIIYVTLNDPDFPDWGNMDLHKYPALFGKGKLLWHEVFQANDQDDYVRAKRDVEAWATRNGYEIVGTERA